LKDSTSYTYQINHQARLQPDILEIEEMLWLFVCMYGTYIVLDNFYGISKKSVETMDQ